MVATSHSEKQLFTAEIPTWLLDADIARVIIEYKEAIYLDEHWQTQKATLLDNLPANRSVSRIDSGRVRILWQADGKTSLWVTDSETGNILGVDNVGEIIVYSESPLLELKYTRYGLEKVEMVAVD